MKDFFISYNQADEQWAKWIAWQLETVGYSVIIQAWDFRPGGNFVLDMQRAAAESRKTIAVLSESYLKSSYTQSEWSAAFAQDPESSEHKLIPVRVGDCNLEGILGAIVYVDLVGLTEFKARQTLLDSLRKRAKPELPPAFPKAATSNSTTPTEGEIKAPKVFPPAQQLITLLKSIDIDKIIKAYSLCLPEARPPSREETLETLISRLEDMPEAQDGLKPIFSFIKYLSKDHSLTSAQREALKAWVQAQGLAVKLLDIEPEEMPANKGETYLMVKVKHRVINDPARGYQISAVLARDPNPFEEKDNSQQDWISIPSPTDPKLSPAYSTNELETILCELLKKCGAQVAITDLVVQLFLPKELMSLPIEHWQLPRGKQSCGQRCKAVLVRSSERYSLDYKWTEGDWKKYWNRFLGSPEANCSKALPILNPQSGNSYIQPHQSTVVGCRFIEHSHQQKQEEFWDDLLSQGLPIAFWIRQLGMTSEKEAKKVMNSVTRSCSIKNLPKSLMKKRQKLLSEVSENERLTKAPLCLLWDNPFRPFPSIIYKS